MAQKSPDAAGSNGEAQESRHSAPIHCSLDHGSTRCSLRSLSFYLIRHKNDYIVRFRCKYPFLCLFFTTCHILLFRVDLASHWTWWRETRWHAEHLKGSQTEGRQSAWQESVLCGGLPFCFWFFFIEFHGKFWVLVSRPRKKSPTFSDVYWWLTSWRSDKAALQVGRQSDEMRGPGSFWRECLLHPYTTRTTSPSWNQKNPT